MRKFSVELQQHVIKTYAFQVEAKNYTDAEDEAWDIVKDDQLTHLQEEDIEAEYTISLHEEEE